MAGSQMMRPSRHTGGIGPVPVLVADSVTPFAMSLMTGPPIEGCSLGHGHLRFGHHVLSLTRRGNPRMPNGVETTASDLEPGEVVIAGGGMLAARHHWRIAPGPIWNPVPIPRYKVVANPRLSLKELVGLAGCGPGLTPLGDDLLAGYLAGNRLLGEGKVPAHESPRALPGQAFRTTSLGATLIRLALQGALPEPAHRLLTYGLVEPVMAWGHSSGTGLLAGLGMHSSAAFGSYESSAPELKVRLQLDRPYEFEIRLVRL